VGQLTVSKYQLLQKPERKWLWLHRQRLKNKLKYLRNSKPRVPKRKASENDDPPPKPKTTCTDPDSSEESKTHLSTAIKADHMKIVTFIDKSAGCQRKSRNPLEGEIISIRGPEGLVLIIPGRMRNKITSML